MSGIGVAISTTGDEHRMGFLETTVSNWARVLPEDAALFVTVDGSLSETRAVERLVGKHADVMRVGQYTYEQESAWPGATLVLEDTSRTRDGRLGVSVNKNTGLELLMDQTKSDHLFLCDDDTYPLLPESLEVHMELGEPHSMVCWGKHRLVGLYGYRMAAWNWPRGVLLYARRGVVARVGGFDERFGPGGHEHVEWSRRIYQHGLTEAQFPSPAEYAESERGPAMGAGRWWHCEDMPRKGEPLGNLRLRRKRITSVRRTDGDWDRINEIMNERDRDTTYVPFRARDNGRASATLCGEQD